MPIPTTWLQFNPTAVPSAAAGVGAGVQINQAELAREALVRQAQQQAAQQALARQQLQQQAALQALNQLTAMQRMEMDREQFAINQSRLGQAFELTKEEAERKRREEDRKNNLILNFQKDIQDPNLDKKTTLEKYLPELDPTGLSDLYKQYRTAGDLIVKPSSQPGYLEVTSPDGKKELIADKTFKADPTSEEIARRRRVEALTKKAEAELQQIENNPKQFQQIDQVALNQEMKIMSDTELDDDERIEAVERIRKSAEDAKRKLISQVAVGTVRKGFKYNGKFPPSDPRGWDKL